MMMGQWQFTATRCLLRRRLFLCHDSWDKKNSDKLCENENLQKPFLFSCAFGGANYCFLSTESTRCPLSMFLRPAPRLHQTPALTRHLGHTNCICAMRRLRKLRSGKILGRIRVSSSWLLQLPVTDQRLAVAVPAAAQWHSSSELFSWVLSLSGHYAGFHVISST